MCPIMGLNIDAKPTHSYKQVFKYVSLQESHQTLQLILIYEKNFEDEN